MLLGADGDIDTAEYMFHENLDVTGASVTYSTNEYTTAGVFRWSLSHTLEKVTPTQVTLSTGPPSTLIFTYDIGASIITRTDHSTGNHITNQQRFQSVGDSRSISGPGAQQTTCTLANHFATFNIHSVIPANIPDGGNYHDVIQFHCVSTSPTAVFSSYLAKDIGIVLQDFPQAYVIRLN